MNRDLEISFPYIKLRHFTKKRKTEESKRTYVFVDLEKKAEFLKLFLFEGVKI
jgi:Holliday junction resolvasome RuvABC DNA-binding subunit